MSMRSNTCLANIFALTLVGCAGAQLTAAEPAPTLPGEQTLSNRQLFEVGNELARRGETLRAEQYFTEAIERGAAEAEVLPHLLDAYVNDRQYRLAAERARDYLRRHPNQTRVRLILAALCQAFGDYVGAAQQLRSVVVNEPDCAFAHYALASVLIEEGIDRALADLHFRKYLELAPRGLYAERAQAALLEELAP